MGYKLLTGVLGESIKNLDTGEVFSLIPGNAQYESYLAWVALGNEPEPPDTPTPAQIAKSLEIKEAVPIAKAFYDANPAVKSFIRDKTPEERKAEISAMTLAQLRTVMWYMVEAVIADIKERYLD